MDHTHTLTHTHSRDPVCKEPPRSEGVQHEAHRVCEECLGCDGPPEPTEICRVSRVAATCVCEEGCNIRPYPLHPPSHKQGHRFSCSKAKSGCRCLIHEHLQRPLTQEDEALWSSSSLRPSKNTLIRFPSTTAYRFTLTVIHGPQPLAALPHPPTHTCTPPT